MITHKHLRQVIEDIYLNDNNVTEELLLRLINEFRYSNLYIPAKRELSMRMNLLKSHLFLPIWMNFTSSTGTMTLKF